MNPHEPSTKKPGRHINKLVIAGFLGLLLFALLGIVFIPWDVAKPEAPDLDPPLRSPALPAAENAFTHFEEAGKLVVKNFSARYPDGTPRDFDSLFDTTGLDGQPGWNLAFADEVIQANAATFAELEKGVACRDYQPPSISPKESIRWLQSQKNLVQLLSLKSLRAQRCGDYTGAGKTGLQGLRFGQLATTNNTVLIEWLVGIALQQISLARLEMLVADAKTPEPVLQEILNTLNQLKPQGIADDFRNAMRGEYCQARQLDLRASVRQWLKEELLPFMGMEIPMAYRFAGIPYACKPNMTLAITIDYQRAVIANADRPYAKVNLDFPSKPVMPATIWEKIAFYAKPNSIGNIWFTQNMVLEKALTKKCRLQAYIAGLHLKIALRLYELKHGELPATLNALVPEYLPEIPQDPYDGQPLRYSKAEKKIWAIGADLIDDGGKKKEENAIMLYRGRGTDAVMSLDPRDPNPPPLKKQDKP
jgi:hypothetical protein